MMTGGSVAARAERNVGTRDDELLERAASGDRDAFDEFREQLAAPDLLSYEMVA